MRILHVTSTFPPYWAGTGNVAYHQARVLQGRGHDVTVLTAAHADGRTLATPFTTHYLPAAFRLGNAPLTLSLLRYLKAADVIHLHYPYIFGAEFTWLAAKLRNIPLVLTYHNQLQETQRIKRFLFNAYNALSEPILLRGAKKVFAVTQGHFAHLHPKLAKSAKVAELPNGVDTTHFKPTVTNIREAFGAGDKPVALFVGALDQAHRFKNVDGLLRAFANLTINAQLWIIGDGDLRSSLENLAAQLGITQRVRFLGKRAPADLPSFYTAADVVVLPSTGVESFGLVLIEAMACATPVIASALPGVKSLVREGVDGWLCTPSDEKHLSSLLTRALSDREQASMMGQAGHEKVLQRYDWHKLGEQLETLYEEVLRETRARAYAA